MNTKTVAGLIIVASLSLVSCKKELQPQESSSDTTAVANPTADPNTVTAAQTPATAQPVQPAQPVQVNPAQMQAAPQPVSQPATVAKGMNPPHGQPNHRCDIAVGAPLNSPPGKTPAPVTKTVTPSTVQKGLPASGVPATLAAPSAPVVTAPGMNPPHGQAGHDCAVAVGAPLPKKE